MMETMSLNDELRIEKLDKLEAIIDECFGNLSCELQNKITKLNEEYYDI